MRRIGDDVRPPSRHKTPPNATGLELPPFPITPPDSDKLEMTWSHTMIEEEAERVERVGMTSLSKMRNEPLKAYRPITVNAWEKPDRPNYNGRVGSANGYKACRKQSLESPI
jgi:hypothetical protein